MSYPLASPIPIAGVAPKIIGDYGVQIGKPSLIPFDLNFSGEQQYTLSLSLMQMGGTFGVPRSIYVNNKYNPNEILLFTQGTSEILSIPAYTIGMLPLSAMANDTITLYSMGGASQSIHVEIYNYERAPYTYGALAPFQSGSNVQALTPAASSIINRNATLSAGVAANVFPTVSNPRNVRFKNVGDGAGGGDVAWYQVNVTATGAFASGDKFLQPGDAEIILPYQTAQRVSFYSTNGTRIQAEEWAN